MLLKSDPISIKIVPATSTWQTARLAADLDKLSSSLEMRKASVADLRYLGTPAAAQVLARGLRDDEPFMNQYAFEVRELLLKHGMAVEKSPQ